MLAVASHNYGVREIYNGTGVVILVQLHREGSEFFAS